MSIADAGKAEHTSRRVIPRGLDASQVVAVLREMKMPVLSGPYGFELEECHAANIEGPTRLRRTSGIGATHQWRIEWAKRPDWASDLAGNKQELRRILREWATHEPKPVLPANMQASHEVYACHHTNRFGECWIWVVREKRKRS